MNAQDLIGKALRAVASARLLLDAGDVDGACNRAYYAMFDAARAALIKSGAPVPPEVAKTHSGLISAFSLHFHFTRELFGHHRAGRKLELRFKLNDPLG